jgi:hypothetical protein
VVVNNSRELSLNALIVEQCEWVSAILTKRGLGLVAVWFVTELADSARANHVDGRHLL